MNNNLLPCGSVVQLKEAQRKLMIIGIGVRDGNTNREFDYVAVPYPEGYLGQEYMFLFNRGDIENIDFLGYVNAEHQAFRAQIAKK